MVACLLEIRPDIVKAVISTICIYTGIRHEVPAFAPESYGSVIHIRMPLIVRIPVVLEDEHGRLGIPSVPEYMVSPVRETYHSTRRLCTLCSIRTHPLQFGIFGEHSGIIAHILQYHILGLRKSIIETLPGIVWPYDIHHEPAGILEL